MLVNSGQVLTERAKISPNTESLVDPATGERYTFRETNARCNRLANALLRLHLNPGERVGCLMANRPQYVEAYYACAKAGFVFVALNWRLTAAELTYQLSDCGASAVLYGAEQRPVVESLRTQFPQIRWLDVDSEEFTTMFDAASAHEPPIGAGGKDILYMMYTSGTTGRPKGAAMSHQANIAWLASMLATSDLRLGDRQITVAPLFHIGGLGMVMCGVYRGVTTVLLRAFEPGQMWDLVAQERINICFLVPAMLNFMYQHPKRGEVDYSSLRGVVCGAAPVPLSLIDAYTKMGIDIYQVYGLTETHGGICLLGPDDAKSRQGSTGRAYFGLDVKVVDKAGEEVPPGIPGEVITRGPHLITCYWNNPAATQDSIRDGWFYTGDIAEVDEDGFIYIRDRSKDMIISGGENIYPAEIEDVLLGHPGVQEAGVIGQPSTKWGESPCAVIVRSANWQRSDAELFEELKTYVQSRLARYKQPKVFQVIDVLPRNPSGKILKRILREQFPGPAPE